VVGQLDQEQYQRVERIAGMTIRVGGFDDCGQHFSSFVDVAAATVDVC
jgi:hypothetical protein